MVSVIQDEQLGLIRDEEIETLERALALESRDPESNL